MSRIGFSVKDLRRRRFHTVVTILALSLCVAIMVSTVLTAESFGLHITALLASRSNVGLVCVFSGFASVITYLSILTGGFMAYFLTSANMRVRTKDIGIMKATGCIPDQAFGYFAVELFLLVSISCIFGIVIGLLLHYSLSAFVGRSMQALYSSFNPWAILEVIMVFAVVSHLFGIRPIVKALQERPAESLFPYHLRGASFKSAQSSFAKFGVSFKVAYRTLLRRKSVTLSTLVCLSIALASASVAFGGTTIAHRTTQSYITLGIGEDLIVIGHEDIVAQYKYFLTQSLHARPKPAIDYTDLRYAIPQTVLESLSSIPNVRVEPRLFQETTVFERPAILIVDNQYFTIGDSRSSEAVVFGFDPRNSISEWLVDGRALNEHDVYAAVVGDSLASTILSSPLDQKVALLGEDFQVVGIALDPINTGLVAYVPFNTLANALGQDSPNLLLLQADPAAYAEALAAITRAIEGTELDLAELNPVLEEQVLFFEPLWSSFATVTLLFLAVVVLCQFTYMTLYITEQEPELAIMRALGARPRRIVAIVMAQACAIIFVSSLIGISVGLVSVLAFLIQSPAILSSDLAPLGFGLLTAIGLLCLTCLIPALRISRRVLPQIVPRL